MHRRYDFIEADFARASIEDGISDCKRLQQAGVILTRLIKLLTRSKKKLKLISGDNSCRLGCVIEPIPTQQRLAMRWGQAESHGRVLWNGVGKFYWTKAVRFVAELGERPSLHQFSHLLAESSIAKEAAIGHSK